MANLKEVKDFLSTLDSIQIKFHDSVVARQREDRTRESQELQTPELSAELTCSVDSQRGTF
jgi:hypothetical protein